MARDMVKEWLEAWAKGVDAGLCWERTNVLSQGSLASVARELLKQYKPDLRLQLQERLSSGKVEKAVRVTNTNLNPATHIRVSIECHSVLGRNDCWSVRYGTGEGISFPWERAAFNSVEELLKWIDDNQTSPPTPEEDLTTIREAINSNRVHEAFDRIAAIVKKANPSC